MSVNYFTYRQQAKVALIWPGLAALLIPTREHRPLSSLRNAFRAGNSYVENPLRSHRRQIRGQLERLHVLSSSEVSPAVRPIATPSLARLPNHLAVIMDGNSRWAQQHGLPEFTGHQNGVDAMRRTVEFSCNQGIHCLTVYAFSDENWQRTNEEVKFLLMLIERVVKDELEKLVAAGVNMKFIGDRSKLPSSLVEQMNRYESLNFRLLLLSVKVSVWESY